ncbi:hypothetical protein LTR97_012103 [Elasticomyces elasticus]|uniref:Retrovirus-related Pol polyprotein from transposon TNT 1-94-like beta-barrel domain-containing protein n=1 Tax=Elasticomyces elasticus TaxID=574655 RepID=A0AAN7VXA4_9PEZI|nr:hypothetical protein LTR97_012103 [Elasticomyces elasticus]
MVAETRLALKPMVSASLSSSRPTDLQSWHRTPPPPSDARTPTREVVAKASDWRITFAPAVPTIVTSRSQAQKLVDDILGTRKRPLAAFARSQRPRTALRETLNKAKAEKLFENILGETRAEEHKRARRIPRRRREAKRLDQPPERSYQWMLHEGNVHYARNSSSFRSYTQVNLRSEVYLGGQTYGVLGIGSVELIAEDAYHKSRPCAITLHSVLHVPKAPTNGISVPMLRKAGVALSNGEDRCNLVRSDDEDAQLSWATRIHNMFRLCLWDEERMDTDMVPVPFELDTHSPGSADCFAEADDVAEQGHAGRINQRIEYWVGTRCDDQVAVGC